MKMACINRQATKYSVVMEKYWLGDQDSNLGSQIQSLMSYRLDDPPNLGVTLLACPSSVKRSVRVTR